MALSPQEQQELAELEELDALEAKAAGQQTFQGNRAPAIEKSKPSMGTSFAAGASQGLTMGYTPQVVGGGATFMGKLQDLIQGPVIDPSTGQAIPRVDYTKARDATVKDLGAAEKANPMTYFGGNIAGSLPAGRLANPTSLKGAVGLGAGMGAVYNPGDKEGVVDPLQAGDRAVNAGIGGVVGGAAYGIGKGISSLAQKADDVQMIKNGTASTTAKSAVDDALEQLEQKQINPRDAELRELIKGKQFEVNPDRVKPVFPRLGQSMAEGLEASPQGLEIAGGPKAVTPARVEISGERALRLKRAADASAGYSSSKPFDPVASAKGEEAKQLADILRAQINSDPRAATLNTEMGETFALKKALADKAKTSPISAISPSETTDRGQLIKMIDQRAGSNLEGLGNRLDSAGDLLISPKRLLRPLEAPDELRKLGVRGAAEASKHLNKVPVNKGALHVPLLELLRQGRSK